MKASPIEIIDGEYARGKEIRVPPMLHAKKGMKAVLKALKFLKEKQETNDRLVFHCISSDGEHGQALYCETFLEKK